MRRTLLALCLLAVPGAVSAQDLAGDLAMANLNHQTMERKLGIDTWSGRPAEQGAATRSTAFPFRSTAASRAAAAKAYLGRIAQSDPDAARATAAEMGRNDFSRIYAGIVAPFGLRTDDAGDAMTAYMVLGYLIATGAPDPGAAQVRAVRAQVGERVANNPAFTDPAQRVRTGEELKLAFVTMHAGWQAARREGALRPYSDGVARMFSSGDFDLRDMRLTAGGLTRR